MKNLKKIKLIMGMLVLTPLISCSNSNSSNASNAENNTTGAGTSATATTAKESSATAAALGKAKKEGNAVFLVITGTGATTIKSAVDVANEAKTLVKKSVVVQMNRDDAANSALVAEFGVGTVAVPFILVISHNGVPVAGLPSNQATGGMLMKSVPSPKQDDVLLAINQKKPVIIVVSKKSFTDKATILENCKTATTKLTSKPVTVEIDMNDVNEKAFLTQVNAATSTNGKSITIVISAAGQINETFTETPTAEKIITAVKKVAKSGGCAPGACGSNKKC